MHVIIKNLTHIIKQFLNLRQQNELRGRLKKTTKLIFLLISAHSNGWMGSFATWK